MFFFVLCDYLFSFLLFFGESCKSSSIQHAYAAIDSSWKSEFEFGIAATPQLSGL